MTGVFASEAEILRIGEGLFARTLPRAEWTHAAHFAAALWLMRTRPEWDAAAVMPGLIRAYNESVGGVNDDHSGYHETITQASLRAARGVLNAYPPDMPLVRIVNALLSSNLANPNWLLEYWSRERLMSVEARRQWLEPDLKPLPF
ncbi:MAG TPA: hypothetical protein VNX61_03200 [Rhizomicrobium sp.]|jgi:hypothetical protein|nr:hypothetical protein [Rhizomicrobium sp.]